VLDGAEDVAWRHPDRAIARTEVEAYYPQVRTTQDTLAVSGQLWCKRRRTWGGPPTVNTTLCNHVTTLSIEVERQKKSIVSGKADMTPVHIL